LEYSNILGIEHKIINYSDINIEELKII